MGQKTDSVMDFPVADGRFLEIIPGKCGDGIFNVLEMKNYIKKKLDSTEYQNLCQKLRNLEIVNKDGLPQGSVERPAFGKESNQNADGGTQNRNTKRRQQAFLWPVSRGNLREV